MAIDGPYTRWWARSSQRFAGTKLGAWVLLNVCTYTDPLLLQLTDCRVSSGPLGGISVGMLTTTGAKSGLKRSVPLMYWQEGADLIFIASNGGKPQHPSWYYNLKANPEATVLLPGGTRDFIAQEAVAEERDRLWARANEIHVGFKEYADRASPRQIPIMVLEPKDTPG